MPIVQCPSCSKKLKAKTPGKKVRCPACSEIFVAGGGGAKKKRQAPVDDDYVDFDDDEQFEDDGYDDEPARPSRRRKTRGGDGGGSRRSKSKGKSAPPAKKSKAPLLIGLGVLSVAILVGVIWAVVGGSGEDETVAANDTNSGGDNAGNDGDNTRGGGGRGPAGGGPAGGGPAGGGPAGGGPAGGSPAGGAPNAGQSGNQVANNGFGDEVFTDNGGQGGSFQGGGDAFPGMTVPGGPGGFGPGGLPFETQDIPGTSVPASVTTPSKADLRYLPANSEVFAVIDLSEVYPVVKPLLLPYTPQIQLGENMLGLKLEDLKSITVGVGGVSDMIGMTSPPNPDDVPVTVVLRASKPIDVNKITTLIAMQATTETISEGGNKFTKIQPAPGEPAGMLWAADANTLVLGPPNAVKAAAGGSAAASIDNSLFDGNSTFQVAFVPTQPQKSLGMIPVPKDAPPEPGADVALDALKTLKPTMNAIGIGIDINRDITYTVSVGCADSSGASSSVAALNKLLDFAKSQMGDAPPMVQDAMKTAKVETQGQSAVLKVVQANGQMQLGLVLPAAMAMLGPAISQAQGAARTTSSRNNLRQVGLAFHNFHDAYKRFPNSASKDGSGKRLLSWRVHLLPFLGRQDVYDRFNLEEPWDSPTNRPLVDQMPNVYRPANGGVASGKTRLLAVTGQGTMFEGEKGRGIREVTDGTANTIMVVQVAPENAVYWTQPDDWELGSNATQGLNDGSGSFQALFVDGSTKTLSSQASDSQLRGFFTRAGAERPDNGIFVTPGAGGPPGGGFPGGSGGGPGGFQF